MTVHMWTSSRNFILSDAIGRTFIVRFGINHVHGLAFYIPERGRSCSFFVVPLLMMGVLTVDPIAYTAYYIPGFNKGFLDDSLPLYYTMCTLSSIKPISDLPRIRPLVAYWGFASEEIEDGTCYLLT